MLSFLCIYTLWISKKITQFPLYFCPILKSFIVLLVSNSTWIHPPSWWWRRDEGCTRFWQDENSPDNSRSRTQDYRLWASWSPYDGPKSFLLGRAESISLQRTWSPCTVNGPSSSHCKGPEVHPTLMDLGPSCWEGLSPPHIEWPKRAMHSQGSIPLQRTEFISTQWTW